MKYINQSGEVYNGRDIIVDGMRIVNPSIEQLEEAGYNPVPDEPVTPDPKAEALAQLQDGDYRIIKCMEAFLTGEEMPYDVVALHAERKAMRAIVNGESELKNEDE
jgi:hypothetical protein